MKNLTIENDDGKTSSRIVQSDGEVFNSKDILKDYPGLVKAMEEESIKIENPLCNMFKQLLYEDEVVGFCTYSLDDGIGDYALNMIYVLPEYRGNHFFLNEIKFVILYGMTLSIYEPNHLLMELLLKYNLAEHLTENLIASAISLDIASDKFESTDKNSDMDDETLYSSNLYDLNISASIFLYDISSTPDTNIIYYSRMLDSDIKDYDVINRRKNIDEDYFEDIKTSILENSDEYTWTLMNLNENLPKPEFNIEYIAGKSPELSDFLQSHVDANALTDYEAKDIQKQLIEEYEENMITGESLLKRLNYLCLNINEDMDRPIPEHFRRPICPYCHNIVNSLSTICHVCGFNLEYTPNKQEEDEEDISFSYLKEDEVDLIDTIEVLEFNDVKFLNGKTGEEERILWKAKIEIFKILTHVKLGIPVNESFFFIDYDIFDMNELVKYIMNNYLSKTLDKESWKFYSEKLTIPYLKKILKAHNQKISGNKSQLIKRIEENIPLEQIDIIGYLNDYKGLDKYEYILNSKAFKFLEENEKFLKFWHFLPQYSYREFEDFCSTHDGNTNEMIFDFLTQHEIKALKINNQNEYARILNTKGDLCKRYNLYEDEAYNEIKKFVHYINPPNLRKLDDPYYNYTQIFVTLRKLQKEIKIDSKKLITKAYEDVKFKKKMTLDKAIELFDYSLEDKKQCEDAKKEIRDYYIKVKEFKQSSLDNY